VPPLPPEATAAEYTPAVIVSTVASVLAAGETASTTTVGKVVEPADAVANVTPASCVPAVTEPTVKTALVPVPKASATVIVSPTA